MSFHVVDDEQEVREILQALISDEGYKVLAFDSAESYLTYFHSSQYVKPTAIITDYRMPGMCGYELVDYIRGKDPFQKVVVLTGTPDSEHKANEHLCLSLLKPFHPEKLLLFVKAMFDCEKKCKAGKMFYTEEICEFGLNVECVFHQKTE